MTRRAVVWTEVGATKAEKVATLKEGLSEIVRELIDEGADRNEIERALEDAQTTADFECPS